MEQSGISDGDTGPARSAARPPLRAELPDGEIRRQSGLPHFMERQSARSVPGLLGSGRRLGILLREHFVQRHGLLPPAQVPVT